MRHFFLLLCICTASLWTAPLVSCEYSTNRDVTTAALSTLTRTVLETLHPVNATMFPFPANLLPLDRRYIDILFRRHLGYGVTPTYLRVVEAIGDANEFIMTRYSGRNNNRFWHRYDEDSRGKLAMNISDRYIREWKAAAVKAIGNSRHYEARVLVGQALHIVQDGHRVPGGNGSLTESAVEAAEGFLREILGQVSASTMRHFLGIPGRKRGRHLTLVVDTTFRDRGGVDRLRAVARWAADFTTTAPAIDIPSNFTVYLIGSDYRVHPADQGLQSITQLMDRLIASCLDSNATKPVCPQVVPGQVNTDPRDILSVLDKAARRAEIGSTIALFTDARFSTNPRMHVPLLQTKNQQLIIVGDPPYTDDRPIYNSLAEKTGGTVVYAGRLVDEIYPYIGFLHIAAKENVVIAAAVDVSTQNEVEIAVQLLPGDVPLGVHVGSDSHVAIDITSGGSYQSYMGGAWVNAPINTTGTWRFKVKSGIEGVVGWSFKAYIQSDIFHNTGLYQYADITEYEPMMLPPMGRMWQHRGYVPLMGNPVASKSYSILMTTPQCEHCETQELFVELIGERGDLFANGPGAAVINNQYLAAEITIPSQPFRIAVSGTYQGQRYKRYSPRLITPTVHDLEITWNRPIDVMTSEIRTGASVLYTASYNSSARLETKELLNYTSNMTRVPVPLGQNKYHFNVTAPNWYYIFDQPINEMVFVVLSQNEQVSADNFIVQHVSLVGGLGPFSPKCTILESSHHRCTANPGCDSYYNAKVRIVDDYDGFQYHNATRHFRDTWFTRNTVTQVSVFNLARGSDGKLAVSKHVSQAECCKSARVYGTDANHEEGVACVFDAPRSDGAAGTTGITAIYTAVVLMSLLFS